MSQLAYLVIREGAKWSDVFRLVPGQAVTVGRAPTNQIVLKDERCSRNHLEVFVSAGEWILRDLDSRNGTMVGNQRVVGDWTLHAGDIVRIGRSQLVFVHRLAEAFADSTSVLRPLPRKDEAAPASADEDEANALEVGGPTTITHRRGQTRFLEPGEEPAEGVSKMGRAAAKLCRLAFELAKAPDAATAADLALQGLAEGTQTDAGGVLLLRSDFRGEPRPDALEVVASRSSTERPYHQVATVLAATVMREGEAVLARNVMGDSTLGSRDSQGIIHTTSVICARFAAGGKSSAWCTSIRPTPSGCRTPTNWSSPSPWPTPWPWPWKT